MAGSVGVISLTGGCNADNDKHLSYKHRGEKRVLEGIIFDYQILNLTDIFFEEHPENLFPEILDKRKRAYNCMIFQWYDNYFICIPFRTEMRHSYGYRFRKSRRSEKHHSGLDYTKMLILSDARYLSEKQAVIDTDEYKEMRENINKIAKGAFNYLKDYILHIKGIRLLQPEEFRRRYQYSALRYFDDLLKNIET